MRRYLGATLAGAVLLLVVASSAGAVDPVNTGRFGGVAIKGYDPVAYFEDGRPVKGDKAIKHTWRGAEWRFASEENRDRFAADPEAYAPQYGGYCAWAVAQGKTAGIDPKAWAVVDSKLYLNYSKSIQKRWEGDVEGHIRDADANWPELVDD
ncbi:MAG: YHS domain-containing (seleno)protein [Acidobacteriota bacterium]